MGGQPVGEEVPLDVAESGLLNIGLGKDGSAAAINNRTRPGGWLHPWVPNASNPQRRELLGAAAVGGVACWRTPRAVSALLPSCWSRGTKGVFDPNSGVVLAIAEVL